MNSCWILIILAQWRLVQERPTIATLVSCKISNARARSASVETCHQVFICWWEVLLESKVSQATLNDEWRWHNENLMSKKTLADEEDGGDDDLHS